jgi:aminoglycoside phosphotransferase (APT) family kinase protein
MTAWYWSASERKALGEFLRAHDICDGVAQLRPIGDGHSNLTFLVSDGTRSAVVRRPPPPPVPPGAHDVLREARLLSALADTDVPVAGVLAVGAADEVIDVPFYVMTYVPGPVVTTRTPAPLDTPAERRRITESLVDTLVAVHAVTGLDGRPEGFNARHLHRMAALVASPPEGFGPVFEWLAARVPPESGATLVHNDFRIGNMVLAPDAPGRIAAVLDWELATVGDPLWDVGYFLASCPQPGEPVTPTGAFGRALLEDGYPARAELAARYAAVSGRDLTGLPWYTVASLWKLAVLYEYSRRRAVDPYYADHGHVRAFLAAATAEIERQTER